MNRKVRILLLLFVAACAFGQVSCKSSGEGFSWRLWGFETHYFTVDGEEYAMRLNTSGSGRYEVELRDGMICISKDGAGILEGGFMTQEEFAAFVKDVLASEEHHVLEYTSEDASEFLLYWDQWEDGIEYNFLASIEDSNFCVIFSTPPGSSVTEEEARDYSHRVQFSKNT